MITYLDFEKPIAELEAKIRELKSVTGTRTSVDLTDDIRRIEDKLHHLTQETYRTLSPWQKTQVARHPQRPHFLDYAAAWLDEYIPLCGDRNFAEDGAIQGGLGRFRGIPIMLIGHEKGHDLKTRMHHNFGMGKPEGYRKAIRLMQMAHKFGLPVVTLIDTPGAYPGVGAEERGQAEAIARATQACFALEVPLVTVIIGEGGSGGAVSLATADHLIMLEHSIYSVISPEGCASILWRDAAKAKDAAQALCLTAQQLKPLGIIDEIIEEPLGGAHRGHDYVFGSVGDAVENALASLKLVAGATLRAKRREKFLAMGTVEKYLAP